MDKFTAGVDGLPHLLEHYYFGFDEAERVDEAVLLKQLASLKHWRHC